MPVTEIEATVDDLYKVDGKAELIHGKIVRMSPTGSAHGRAALRIATSLETFEEQNGGGYAFGDNVGFLTDLPGRKSFSPDVAWYVGELSGADFLPHAPAFAVEVRSKDDYGRSAEREISAKRSEYFSAGTQVVWDVDLDAEDVVRCYRADEPERPRTFRRGEVADAEPAVPGWTFEVDRLFR